MVPIDLQDINGTNLSWEEKIQRALVWQISATCLCLDTVFALKTQESTNSNNLTTILEQQNMANKLITTEGRGLDIDKVADELFHSCIVPHIPGVPWCILFEDQVEAWYRERSVCLFSIHLT